MMHVSRSVVVIGLKLNLLLELLRKPQHKALHYRYYDVCNCTIKLLKQKLLERAVFCCLCIGLILWSCVCFLVVLWIGWICIVDCAQATKLTKLT